MSVLDRDSGAGQGGLRAGVRARRQPAIGNWLWRTSPEMSASCKLTSASVSAACCLLSLGVLGLDAVSETGLLVVRGSFLVGVRFRKC